MISGGIEAIYFAKVRLILRAKFENTESKLTH